MNHSNSYPVAQPSEPRLSPTEKRERDRNQKIETARKDLKYHEERLRQIVADKDQILQQLSKSDYESFKDLSREDKEGLLQKLRAVDYHRFLRLEADEEAAEKAVVATQKKLKKLEGNDGSKKK